MSGSYCCKKTTQGGALSAERRYPETGKTPQGRTSKIGKKNNSVYPLPKGRELSTSFATKSSEGNLGGCGSLKCPSEGKDRTARKRYEMGERKTKGGNNNSKMAWGRGRREGSKRVEKQR